LCTALCNGYEGYYRMLPHHSQPLSAHQCHHTQHIPPIRVPTFYMGMAAKSSSTVHPRTSLT
jgi:hypothetical protein